MPAPLRIKYTQEKEWLCMSEQEMTKADNRQRYIELGYNIAYYRKHAGLTQGGLCFFCFSYSSSTVSTSSIPLSSLMTSSSICFLFARMVMTAQ